MNRNHLMKLREKLMEELEKFGKDDLKLETPIMESIYKLSESIKAIDTICAMDGRFEDEDYYDENMNGNSQTGMSHRNSNNSYRRSYTGMSNRGAYQGQYGYGWPMSYDDAKFNMVHKLGDLMMCTENEHTKSVLRNAISQLENN